MTVTPSRIAAALTAVAVAAALVLGGVALGRHTSAHASPAHRAVGPSAVDIGFAQDMATHHDQALLMANLALTRGSPTVRSIADTILLDQSQETGQLRGWLQLWHQPVADPHPMRWMSGTSGQDAAMTAGALMPGMATPSETLRLYRLRGAAFDVLFLQLMIRHHQGGIEMAHDAELHARLGFVRSAATAMRVEQVQDLALMVPLLRADGGHELPAP